MLDVIATLIVSFLWPNDGRGSAILMELRKMMPLRRSSYGHMDVDTFLHTRMDTRLLK